VGRDGYVGGDKGDAEQGSPETLPTCDVLQLDCDGAELEILKTLAIEPLVVIVEIYGMYGISEADIDHIMDKKGYAIAGKRTYDDRNGGYVKTYIQ
jgi:hypothetical protein